MLIKIIFLFLPLFVIIKKALVVSPSESSLVSIEHAINELRGDQQAIKDEQKVFRENIAEQKVTINSLQSLLKQILEKLSSSTPSTSKN